MGHLDHVLELPYRVHIVVEPLLIQGCGLSAELGERRGEILELRARIARMGSCSAWVGISFTWARTGALAARNKVMIGMSANRI